MTMIDSNEGALLRAAQRLISRAQAASADEISPRLAKEQDLRGPLGLDSLRQVVEALSSSQKHIERVFTAREAIYKASIESLSKSLNVLAGRVDFLADELHKATSSALIQTSHQEVAETTAFSSALSELSKLQSMGRAYIDEATAIRADVAEEARALLEELKEMNKKAN